MDELTVTVAILFVVFAVHTVFAVYLFRSLTDSETDRSDDESPPGGKRGFEASEPPEESEKTTDSDRDISAERKIQCPTCGVPNVPDFQFCRHCVSDLSEGSAQNTGMGSSKLGG